MLETALCPGCHVFCPLIISACSSLIAEHELEYWFSVKHFPLFIRCFFSVSRRGWWTQESNDWLRLNTVKIHAHPCDFYSCALALPIHESSTTSQSAASVSDIIPTDVRQKRRQYIWLHVTYSPTQSHRTQQNILDESQQQAHCLACKGAQVHRWEPRGLSATNWHRCHTEVHHRPPLPPPPPLPTPCPHLSPRIEVN